MSSCHRQRGVLSDLSVLAAYRQGNFFVTWPFCHSLPLFHIYIYICMPDSFSKVTLGELPMSPTSKHIIIGLRLN